MLNSLEYDTNLPPFIEVINENIVRKHASASNEDFLKIKSIIEKYIAEPSEQVVNVLFFQIKDTFKFFNKTYVNYCYDMKRLYKLSEEERDIIHSASTNLCCMWEDDVPLIKLGKEKYPNLIKLLKEIIHDNEYHDLHSYNILKDSDGSYKIVDLEGFV